MPAGVIYEYQQVRWLVKGRSKRRKWVGVLYVLGWVVIFSTPYV